MEVTIRKGNPTDFEQALKLIQELAAYEKEPDAVKTTVESMHKDQDLFDFVVAELQNKIIGIALYFPYYSTWEGRCIYLEDIVVTAAERRKGVGKLLFDKIVEEANSFGAKRLMWQVLDWNEPAIEFYKNINAHLDSEWVNCKLSFDHLRSYKINN